MAIISKSEHSQASDAALKRRISAGKKISISTLVLIIVVILFSAVAHANDESLVIQLKSNFIRSAVPAEIALPPVPEADDPYSLYQKHFEKTNPELLKFLAPNKDNDFYRLKKFSGSVVIFPGYPSYLVPRIAPDSEKLQSSMKQIRSALSVVLAENKIKNASIADSAESANVFLMPVTNETYIDVYNPDIRFSPQVQKDYGGILAGIRRVFFNQNLYQLNSQGLKGSFLNDSDGHIIVSFCPVDIQKNLTAIQDNILYCIFQSQGLPGFYRRYSQINDDSIMWGKRLLRVLDCEFSKPNESAFDLNYQEIFNNCLQGE